MFPDTSRSCLKLLGYFGLSVYIFNNNPWLLIMLVCFDQLNSEDEWIKVLDSVPEQDAKSQKIISEFTEDLHSMEKNRVDKIQSILRKCRKEVNTIAYLSPENTEKLFKEELEVCS